MYIQGYYKNVGAPEQIRQSRLICHFELRKRGFEFKLQRAGRQFTCRWE